MVRSFCSMGSKDKERFIESQLSVEGGSGGHIGFSILAHLEEDEEVSYETRRHWATTMPFLAVALLLARFTNALSLFLVLPALFQMKTYEYAVTDRRIVAKWGLLKTRVDSIPLEEIEDVAVTEGRLGRLLGLGNATIRAKGKKYRFCMIEDPRAFLYYANQALARSRAEGAASREQDHP